MLGACGDYIKSVALKGSYVGIVQFSGDAGILSDLELLVTDEDRSNLTEHLPLFARGGTCIGCGLHRGLEVGLSLVINQCRHWQCPGRKLTLDQRLANIGIMESIKGHVTRVPHNRPTHEIKRMKNE